MTVSNDQSREVERNGVVLDRTLVLRDLVDVFAVLGRFLGRSL